MRENDSLDEAIYTFMDITGLLIIHILIMHFEIRFKWDPRKTSHYCANKSIPIERKVKMYMYMYMHV